MTARRELGAATACIVVGLWASSAPTMLYPLYQRSLGLGFVATTALFATYPVVLLLGLCFTGGLSDRIGRSGAVVSGPVLVAVGAAISLVPPTVPGLFVSRAVEGLGVGLVLPAANAWLGDALASRAGGARLASTISASAAAAGTIAALLVGAAGVDTSEAVAMGAQWPLLLVALVVGLACRQRPASRTPASRAIRRIPSLPPAAKRRLFWTGTTAAAASYMVTAVFLSLGAHIGMELTDFHSAMAEAAALALFPVATACVPWLTLGLDERTSLLLGGTSSLVGMLSLVAVAHGSAGLLEVAAVSSGAGFGLLARGGTSLVQQSVPASLRGGGLASMSIVMYAAQAVTALAAGVAAETYGLRAALGVVAPLVAIVALGPVLAVRGGTVAVSAVGVPGPVEPGGALAGPGPASGPDRPAVVEETR